MYSGKKYEMHPDSTPSQDVSRPATMIVYLSDVEAGGQTIFPVTSQNAKQCASRWHGDCTWNEFSIATGVLCTPAAALYGGG